MFRILFTSFYKSEYQELSLCSHDYDVHGSLSRPYETNQNYPLKLPE